MGNKDSCQENESVLTKALNECLEEEVKRIPTDNKIKKLHFLSEEFDLSVKGSIFPEKKRFFKKRYPLLALAAAACICIYITVLNNWTVTEQKQAKKEQLTGTEDSGQAIGEQADSTITADDAEQNYKYEMADHYAVASLDKEAYHKASIVRLTILNESDMEISADGYYSVEVLKEEGWEAVPFQDENYGFKDIMYVIDAGAALDFTIDLGASSLNPEYDRYRIVKSVLAGEEDITVYAEFILEETTE